MILVSGAGGKTGKAVIRALSSKGAAVRGFARHEEQRQDLLEAGAAEVAFGDMLDAGAFVKATQGANKIYHICPNVHPKEVEIGENAISAAEEAGIEHFVYHSVLHPQIEAMPHHWLKMRVEEMLLASGLAWTFMRPTAYMQNIGGQWEKVKAEGIYEVPYSLDTRVSLVDLNDVAEAAAQVLTEEDHALAAYDLCSPETPDQREIADMLGNTAGRMVEARKVSIEEWDKRAQKAGLGKYARETLIKMFTYYEGSHLLGSSNDLEGLLGRKVKTLEDYLATIV
ncbi:MAG: NmrA family NAD(P)-binding protein [Anaerolineae bacterium]|nr:NmrA family NAD(P)-binding protein [Anaerolineae bacterium]